MESVRIPVFFGGRQVSSTLVDPDVPALLEAKDCRLDPQGYVRWGRTRVHRLILGLAVGDARQVDHISQDKLDNRRVNLRIVTRAENNQNRSAQQGSTSAHRGVSWHKGRRKWQAVVVASGEYHYLGLYELEDDAASAASAFRAEHMPFSEQDQLLS